MIALQGYICFSSKMCNFDTSCRSQQKKLERIGRNLNVEWWILLELHMEEQAYTGVNRFLICKKRGSRDHLEFLFPLKNPLRSHGNAKNVASKVTLSTTDSTAKLSHTYTGNLGWHKAESGLVQRRHAGRKKKVSLALTPHLLGHEIVLVALITDITALTTSISQTGFCP